MPSASGGPRRRWKLRGSQLSLRSPDIIAYGIGGDELGLPTIDLRPVYDFVASQGMHRVIHAGEIGGPEIVRESVELLGVERIGHGIA